MTDYIKREDALEQFDYYDLGEYLTTQIRGMLMDVPSADVAPVRHAKWIDDDEEYLRRGYQFANCSVCGFQMDVHENRGYYNYCPLCGAKMGEEEING